MGLLEGPRLSAREIGPFVPAVTATMAFGLFPQSGVWREAEEEQAEGVGLGFNIWKNICCSLDKLKKINK